MLLADSLPPNKWQAFLHSPRLCNVFSPAADSYFPKYIWEGKHMHMCFNIQGSLYMSKEIDVKMHKCLHMHAHIRTFVCEEERGRARHLF